MPSLYTHFTYNGYIWLTLKFVVELEIVSNLHKKL